ncbi:MAG: hypothetical protein IPM11_01155 [Micropruina sp.]|nr:hypothetical protein [Micropruina sp.]
MGLTAEDTADTVFAMLRQSFPDAGIDDVYAASVKFRVIIANEHRMARRQVAEELERAGLSGAAARVKETVQ